MSEFDKWFKAEMPNSHKKVNKDRIETVIYSCAEAAWDYQQAKINDSENTRAVLYRENMDIREKNADLQSKIDNLKKENYRLNTWYKNAKLQLENKQIDCDRSDRETDHLKKKYDAMYNAFIVADDCRKDWHESYMSACKERDELQGHIDDALRHVIDHGGYDDLTHVIDILKGNKDE